MSIFLSGTSPNGKIDINKMDIGVRAIKMSTRVRCKKQLLYVKYKKFKSKIFVQKMFV